MQINPHLPLRIFATDPCEQFQLGFSEQAAALVGNFSGVQCQATARGLALYALAERDLTAAAAMLRAAFPVLLTSRIEVLLRDQGAMEPYVRVRVMSPQEYSRDVIAQLHSRGAVLDCPETADPKVTAISGIVRLAAMLGYDDMLARATDNRGTADYSYSGYRPVVSVAIGAGPADTVTTPDPRIVK